MSTELSRTTPEQQDTFVRVPVSLLRECRRLMLFAEYTQEAFARRRDATNAGNEIVRLIETQPSENREINERCSSVGTSPYPCGLSGPSTREADARRLDSEPSAQGRPALEAAEAMPRPMTRHIDGDSRHEAGSNPATAHHSSTDKSQQLSPADIETMRHEIKCATSNLWARSEVREGNHEAIDKLCDMALAAVERCATPVATVINNNRPGWTFIAETAPHVTLDVGTKLYALPVSSVGARDAEIEELARDADHVYETLLDHNIRSRDAKLLGGRIRALKGHSSASSDGIGLSANEASVIAAAVALVPLLEEGWDDQDTPEDRNEGAKACDALVAAVNAMLAAPQYVGEK